MRIHGGLRLGAGLRARLGFAAVMVLVFSLAACGSVNVVSEGGDSNLMLLGNDPVAYFAAGRPLPGRGDIKTEHRGLTYRFASDENRRQFITNPEHYVPQFGGFCAQAMAYAVPAPANAGSFKIIDGKLYLFASARASLLRDGPGAQPEARLALLGSRGRGLQLAPAGLETAAVPRAALQEQRRTGRGIRATLRQETFLTLGMPAEQPEPPGCPQSIRTRFGPRAELR